MKNNSGSKTTLLITGGAVIALALMLFVNAMIIGDFAQPGAGLFHGGSNVRLVAAFTLLIGLACTLLFMIAKAGRSGRNESVCGDTLLHNETAQLSAETPGKAVPLSGVDAVEVPASAEIISDTAGELRTTVDVIQEELEEILDDDVPADKEHMQSLYDETDRLKRIIAGMELLSRVQVIAKTHQKEILQIEPLLKGIIEATRLAVTDRNVTYDLECETGLAMQGNPECISRIIGNITDNAARSIKGSGIVKLTAARKDGLVIISITDTGAGIRRAHLSHIYERYFRGTGSGIGMGLSIAKELVDACEGKIEVRTAVNKGTTFTVTLPAEHSEAPNEGLVV